MKAQITGSRRIKRVVITRSRTGNLDLSRRLREIGFEPIPIDTIEFLPPADWSAVDVSLARLSGFDWLLFTSATGVEFFVQRMKALSLALPWQGRPAVAAVGERTRSALREVGIKVGFVPSKYLTKALADELPRDLGKTVLLLRADIGDPEVVPALERDGFKVSDLAIYRTSPVAERGQQVTETSLGDAQAIVFASPSAVEAFIGRLDSPLTGSALAKRLLAVCIGPVTARAARERGFQQILIPKTYTIESAVESLRSLSADGEGK